MHDDLIDRANAVLRELASLEQEKNILLKKILEAGAKPGDLLVSKRGNKIRVCDRAVLQEDLLKASVSPSIWNRITVRKPVAALIQKMVAQKKISEDVAKACYRRSHEWIELR